MLDKAIEEDLFLLLTLFKHKYLRDIRHQWYLTFSFYSWNTSTTKPVLSDLGSVLEGGCYSGQLKGTFVRKKKYFLRKDFCMTKLLVTPLHVAPAAALLVSSIQVASPGCDIVPGEALAAGLSVPPAGLWSVELVSHPRSHLSLSTDTSWEGRGASEKSRFTADTTQTWGPQEPRHLGEGGRDDILQWWCLESHHGSVPGGPWQCARRMRDGSPLPAKSGTEQEGGLIFWAGEHKPPGKGQGLQRHNKAGAPLSQQLRDGSVETGPHMETPELLSAREQGRKCHSQRTGGCQNKPGLKTSTSSRHQLDSWWLKDDRPLQAWATGMIMCPLCFCTKLRVWG